MKQEGYIPFSFSSNLNRYTFILKTYIFISSSRTDNQSRSQFSLILLRPRCNDKCLIRPL